MELATAAKALEILNGTWTAIQNVRGRVEVSKDNALKVGYGGLLDDFNRLRVITIKLIEENDRLRGEQISNKPEPEIRQHGNANYYFIGEDGPYCQPCYDGSNHRLVNLTPRQEFGNGMGRRCLVCDETFIEVDVPARATRRSIDYDPYSGPDSWMR
jgi:hypothetical protein